jgi:hypothetical protein
LAGAEPHLFSGIHLPDLVGLLGTLVHQTGPASFGGGVQAGLLQPALQGAFTGQRLVGMLALPQHAEQARAPTGMLPAPGEYLLTEFVLRRVGTWSDVVGRSQGIGTVLAEAR